MGLIAQLVTPRVHGWLIKQESNEMTVCFEWLGPNPQLAQ